MATLQTIGTLGLMLVFAAVSRGDRFGAYGNPLTQRPADEPAYTDYQIAAGVAMRQERPLAIWVKLKTEDAPQLRAELADAIHVELDTWPTYRAPGVLFTDRQGMEYTLHAADIGPNSGAKIKAAWQWDGPGPSPMTSKTAYAEYQLAHAGQSASYQGYGSGKVVNSVRIELMQSKAISAPTIKFMSYQSIPTFSVYQAPAVPMLTTYSIPIYSVPMYGAAKAMSYGNSYGTLMGNGQYMTPTGLPPGPGVFGVPGAGFPFDGPIRRALRGASGFDPGPRVGSVKAGFGAGGC